MIRAAQAEDVAAVHAVHRGAFPTAGEADLVNALRRAGRVEISLVAEEAGRVVGHAMLSPVNVDGMEGGGLGLGPVAVLPEMQRRGIGGAMVREGLIQAGAKGWRFVVVLGDPEYYGRFGFERASRFGLRNEFGVDEEFMVIGVGGKGVPEEGGLVRYAPEFAALG